MLPGPLCEFCYLLEGTCSSVSHFIQLLLLLVFSLLSLCLPSFPPFPYVGSNACSLFFPVLSFLFLSSSLVILFIHSSSCDLLSLFLHLFQFIFLSSCLLYIPPGQTPPPASHTPGQTHTPRQMATAADGTHPIGMHSCFISILLVTVVILILLYN